MPITKDTPLSDIIHDFVHSDDPKFAGKSKEERIRQAKGAFYGMQKEDNVAHYKANGSVDLIGAISEGDTLTASKLFSKLLMSRVSESIERRRQAVAQSMFMESSAISKELHPNKFGFDSASHDSSGITYTAKQPIMYNASQKEADELADHLAKNHEDAGHTVISKSARVSNVRKNGKHYASDIVVNVKIKHPNIKSKIMQKESVELDEVVLPGHPYHNKTQAELQYIMKDAAEAAKNMKGYDPKAESKYLDQVNDASTILNLRKRLGSNQK